MPPCLALLPAALLPLCPPPAAQGSVPVPSEAAPVRLEPAHNPVAELYFELRARAAAGEVPTGDDPLAPALAATGALQEELGWILSWGPLDARLEGCATAADLRAAFAACPERSEVRRPGAEPREVPLRALALALADALAAVEAQWTERVWPARERRLAEAAEHLDAILNGPQGAALYRDLCRGQRMLLETERVPVLLVTRVPRPGAVTFRRAGGGGICIVGLEGLADGLLVETVVHESIHALDASTEDQPTVLNTLRRALAEAGVDRRDRRGADAAHALLFLHAGELVRRHLDPEHVDYGEHSGVYARLAAPIERERELFLAWLDGELELDELTRGIVSALEADR